MECTGASRGSAWRLYRLVQTGSPEGLNRMMKSLLRRIGAALGLSLLLGQVPAQARSPQPGHPALWEVSDPDTTIYLFGTIHRLPDGLEWRTPELDQAMASAQELVVETIVDEKNPAKLMGVMASLGFAQGLPPLAERVPAAQRPTLAAAIKQSGFPPQALDRMKTWTAAIILLGNKFKELGLGGGVEGVLKGDFSAKGKPIGELESNVEQLSFFDRLPEPAQRQWEQMDRATPGEARRSSGRGRCRSPRRQGFGSRNAEEGRLLGPAPAIAPTAGA
jgi:uncharacterized protein YbaP (TraB family)